MTSSKVRLEQIAEPENLREAFLRAARGKGHRGEVIAFRANLDAELAAVRTDLLAGTVAVGKFSAFTIHEPKERRIHAPCFRERVLHHALVGPCEGDFERWLIDDSFACRRGKGRERALRRAEHHAGKHEWFLKLDVAKYFDSISHAVLLGEVRRRFRDARVVALWERIVSAYAHTPGCGLPIGALTSQHLANFFLGRADRFAKETLRVPGYARYMDDMALWGDREQLRPARVAMENFLRDELGLKLKENWHLQPTRRGMDFIGYRVGPHGSRLARASRRRFVRKWIALERARESGAVGDSEAQRRVLALTAFVRVARGERLLARIFGKTLGTGHRAPTASIAAAVGITPPTIAAPPTATGMSRGLATTTSASASPSAHATAPAGRTD